MKTEKSLPDLEIGEEGVVNKLLSEGKIRRRFLDIGLIPGTVVTCFGRSPLGDPSAYKVRGKLIAIRKSDAEKIIIF